ncbi:MAG: sulfopyruvate decarboxylase subunit beta [Acidobacteriota bacterium]|nr:sulfopyruvate decarboxylase subunit beta [Acidobacteriota bacterium]
MKRAEAIRTIVNALDAEAVIHATGMISRESFSVKDREANFYMIGSMGLNSAIGLGVALSCPSQRVVILDGDGSVLMNMGMLASIAEASPSNLVHIVLDNESYASTGGQRSISDHIELERVAAAVGYKYTKRVESLKDLSDEIASIWSRSRPAFLLAKVEPGNEEKIARVSHSPVEIKERFMRSVQIRA